MTKGGRNLAIMGVAASVIAIAATSVSLIIYHNSGDIYLDRSRPGFLPDEEEIEEEIIDEEDGFDPDGPVTKEDLDEYIKALTKEIEAIDSYKAPFDIDVISNENLGI